MNIQFRSINSTSIYINVNNVIFLLSFFSVCQCNPYGSSSRVCDAYSGACKCHANVIGNFCDKCKPGYFNMKSGKGCIKCDCHNEGSQNQSCNAHTGECICKPGVTGKYCDRCGDEFYGFSFKGCKSKYFLCNFSFY